LPGKQAADKDISGNLCGGVYICLENKLMAKISAETFAGVFIFVWKTIRQPDRQPVLPGRKGGRRRMAQSYEQRNPEALSAPGHKKER